ncbi:MAG: hypothetical protein JWM11_2910 [Planctomycetaceae bacterium]|nr:hypothetical protein [Planctomycetaceae bacterium]
MSLITAVRKRTYFGRSDRVKAVHSAFFHGRGARDGEYFPLEPNAYLTNDVRASLEVVRPGAVFPPVSQPAGQLICTSDVKQILQHDHPVEFLPVVLTKVVDHWIPEGDMHYYLDPATSTLDAHQFLLRFPDARQSFREIPPLWELLIPKLLDVVPQFDDLKKVEFYFGETGYGNGYEFELSASLIEKYPIFGQSAITFFQDDIYQKIAKFINEDYFCMCSREV